jgi:hypothetical protein
MTSVGATDAMPGPESARRGGAITGRALALGALGALAIGLGGPWVDHAIRGSYMTLDFSTPGAIFLLFAFCLLVQAPLCRRQSRHRFRPAEIVTIYSMMTVASAICTQGLTAYLVPFPSAAFYYSTPENRWGKLLLEHVPAWAVPQGAEAGAPVIRALFEGLPPGAAVPWGRWLPALLAWAPLIAALFAMMVAAMVLLRRQWVEHERLTYSLTQLPLQLAGAETEGRPAVLGSRVFWCGLAVPVVLGALKGLHAYFPTVPTVPQAWAFGAFGGRLPLQIQVSWALLGFFYMVNREGSLSLWLLNRVYFVVQGVMSVLGIAGREVMGVAGGSAEPYFAHFGTGALIALVASSLWVGRGHLRRVRAAVVGAEPGYDAGEALSFRAALLTLGIGGVTMLWWLTRSGLPIAAAGLLLLLAFVFYVGITRVVADFGFAAATSPKQAPNILISWLGSRTLGPAGVVGAGLTFVWCSDNRNFVMCSVANSLKAADVVEDHRGRLVWAYAIAIVVAGVSSVWLTTARAYGEGGVTMNNWYFNAGPNFNYAYLAQKVQEPAGPAWYGLGLAGAGAALYMGLAGLRYRFTGWPLHPLGLAVGGVWMMDTIWFTCFLSWFLKTLILRYGGNRLYQGLRPAFLGLICGQFTINAAWLVVDQLTGKKGNIIFWI